MTAVLRRQGAFYGALLLAWWGLARWRIWPPYVFPGPGDVGSYLLAGLRDGSLLWGVGTSLKRLLLGYGASVAGGVALGTLLAQSRWLGATLGGLVLGLQTLPSVCWLPLSLLWFGLNESAILFVVIMGAILAITISTQTGIQQVPQLYVRAGRTLGARGVALYLRVIFPAAFPVMLTGFKQGWSFAWRSLMAGELIYVTRGLGFLLQAGRELNDVAQLFGVMLVIIGIGAFVDYLVFRRLERWVRRRWGFSEA